MTHIEVKELIESIGLPCNYYQWKIGQEPELPYLLFYFPENNDFKADDKNYQHISKLNIELYTNDKDFETEAIVDAALEAADMIYKKSEAYIEEERMYEVLYQTEVIING